MKELFVIAAGLACLAITGAKAQGRDCADRTQVVARLADGHGESRQAIGLGAGDQVVETFANLESGAWTVIVTLPNGVACLAASGKAFELVEEAAVQAGETGA